MWDEEKRLKNLRKHGLDFKDTIQVFQASPRPYTALDLRNEYGEDRLLTFGPLGNGRVVAIAHTEEQNTIRVISMRYATANEEALYFQATRR